MPDVVNIFEMCVTWFSESDGTEPTIIHVLADNNAQAVNGTKAALALLEKYPSHVWVHWWYEVNDYFLAVNTSYKIRWDFRLSK